MEFRCQVHILNGVENECRIDSMVTLRCNKKFGIVITDTTFQEFHFTWTRFKVQVTNAGDWEF